MLQYRICGQSRIAGDLCIGGAKNAVLPILAAVCLNESESEIYNCPSIADTHVSLDILKAIGCKLDYHDTKLRVRPPAELAHNIPQESVCKMRSSILFMGALLGRVGKVVISMPGGCELGNRAIDLHLSGLRAMGATIHQIEGSLYCEAPRLHGAKIHMHTASVGATQNLMLAATLATGDTAIKNAAREPEVIDLAVFLNSMGAKIEGAGTGTIYITGVKKLHEAAPHVIMPDRIVAGTYMVAAAMTNGSVALHNIRPADMQPIVTPLSAMGCNIYTQGSSMVLVAPKKLNALPHLVTQVHPGFPTDMQAQLVAALAIADGTSIVTENIFDKRTAHIPELNKMGANIAVKDTSFTVQGCNTLAGTTVAAHDLRCGAALVLAGLAAHGETVVQNAQYVQRGYTAIERDLTSLGADIVLEDVQ